MYIKESDTTGITTQALHDGIGEIHICRFFESSSQTGVNFHVWELPPGTSEGMHIHSGEDNYEETYYFVAGSGIMWIAGEVVPVAAGDAVLVPPGIDHGFKNTGTQPLKLVLLFGKPLAGTAPA